MCVAFAGCLPSSLFLFLRCRSELKWPLYHGLAYPYQTLDLTGAEEGWKATTGANGGLGSGTPPSQPSFDTHSRAETLRAAFYVEHGVLAASAPSTATHRPPGPVAVLLYIFSTALSTVPIQPVCKPSSVAVNILSPPLHAELFQHEKNTTASPRNSCSLSRKAVVILVGAYWCRRPEFGNGAPDRGS